MSTKPGATPVEGASSEFELLVGCVRALADDVAVRRVRELSQGPLDWDGATRLAAKHGMLGLLYHNLRQCSAERVPDRVLAHLEEQYYSSAIANGLLVRALVKVLKSLECRGVPAVPFKGAVLAVSAYGSLALRFPGDLDILVRPSDMKAACEQLLSEGFSLDSDYGWESCLVSSDGRVCVDLHWGICKSSRRAFIPPPPWWLRLRPVCLAGTTVLQFAPEETVLILCANAAKNPHRVRLGTLADIAVQVHSHSALDWSYLLQQAHRLQCRSVVGAGLLLAHELLGVRLPDAVQRRLSGWWRARGLAVLLLTRLLHPGAALPATGVVHALLTAEEFREQVEGLKSILTPNARDRDFLPLPTTLSFLHPLVRPIRLLKEYGRELWLLGGALRAVGRVPGK